MKRLLLDNKCRIQTKYLFFYKRGWAVTQELTPKWHIPLNYTKIFFSSILSEGQIKPNNRSNAKNIYIFHLNDQYSNVWLHEPHGSRLFYIVKTLRRILCFYRLWQLLIIDNINGYSKITSVPINKRRTRHFSRKQLADAVFYEKRTKDKSIFRDT